MSKEEHIHDANAHDDAEAHDADTMPSAAADDTARSDAIENDGDVEEGSEVDNGSEDESGSEEEEASPTSILVEKALKVLPWGSLLIAIISALIMDRSPKSAWMVVTAAVLGWGAIIGFGLLSQLDPDKYEGKKRLLVKAAAVLSLVVTQSLMQQCLFFSIPFYVGAMRWRPTHVTFVVVLLAAAAITMWDPIYERFMKNSGLRFILQSLAIFAGLNVVIPVMGFANQTSLFVSALVAGLGVPLQGWVSIPRDEHPSKGHVSGLKKLQWDVFGLSLDAMKLEGPQGKAARTQFMATLAALAFPIIIVNFSAPVIPPAPLKMVHAQLATSFSKQKKPQQEEILYTPAELNCVTWISAPRGVHEKLFHVWTRNGHVRDRIELDIKGGNKAGYRTNSRKKRLTPDPSGTWTCSVVTEAGQYLGETSLTVKP